MRSWPNATKTSSGSTRTAARKWSRSRLPNAPTARHTRRRRRRRRHTVAQWPERRSRNAAIIPPPQSMETPIAAQKAAKIRPASLWLSPRRRHPTTGSWSRPAPLVCLTASRAAGRDCSARNGSSPSALALVVVALLSVAALIRALDNGLALRPPMGWMNWERFTCQIDCAKEPDNCVSERLFRQMADRLVAGGYLGLGYEYLSIDDCWSEMERDPLSGRLVANASRFPSGLAELADYMHRRHIRLGIYGDCGERTCAGYPAQLRPAPTGAGATEEDNYFQLDAQTFAEWRLDAFKFDGCYIEPHRAESICPRMAGALRQATHHQARPILLTCEWPFYMMYAHLRPNYTLAGESCNLWRYYDDIQDSWWSILNTVDYTVKHQSTIVKYHGPGHWFDPDQLVIGNFGLSLEQARAQMALWCIWSAPLYMSNDLRSIRPEFAEILKNKHLIGVDQDALGILGQMVASEGAMQAFVKPILPVRHSCPSFALVYLNRETLGNRKKESFKLRDLLRAAPIYEAAGRLRELQAAGRETGSEPIEARKCLKRLAAAEAEGEEEEEEEALGPVEAFDLFAGGDSLGEFALDSSLGLLVAPSGVRALRLSLGRPRGLGTEVA